MYDQEKNRPRGESVFWEFNTYSVFCPCMVPLKSHVLKVYEQLKDTLDICGKTMPLDFMMKCLISCVIYYYEFWNEYYWYNIVCRMTEQQWIPRVIFSHRNRWLVQDFRLILLSEMALLDLFLASTIMFIHKLTCLLYICE